MEYLYKEDINTWEWEDLEARRVQPPLRPKLVCPPHPLTGTAVHFSCFVCMLVFGVYVCAVYVCSACGCGVLFASCSNLYLCLSLVYTVGSQLEAKLALAYSLSPLPLFPSCSILLQANLLDTQFFDTAVTATLPTLDDEPRNFQRTCDIDSFDFLISSLPPAEANVSFNNCERTSSIRSGNV